MDLAKSLLHFVHALSIVFQFILYIVFIVVLIAHVGLHAFLHAVVHLFQIFNHQLEVVQSVLSQFRSRFRILEYLELHVHRFYALLELYLLLCLHFTYFYNLGYNKWLYILILQISWQFRRTF